MLDADGTFDYDPNGQFESLATGETTTDTFAYTVGDGNGGTDTATVSITIDGVNDDPAASVSASANTTAANEVVTLDATASTLKASGRTPCFKPTSTHPTAISRRRWPCSMASMSTVSPSKTSSIT